MHQQEYSPGSGLEDACRIGVVAAEFQKNLVIDGDIQLPPKYGSTRPGERSHFAMERSTIFNGKIHYFYGQFSIATLNYQRV